MTVSRDSFSFTFLSFEVVVAACDVMPSASRSFEGFSRGDVRLDFFATDLPFFSALKKVRKIIFVKYT